MIRYHGTPITPNNAAVTLLPGRHAMVSHANPGQIGLVAEVASSFALDNGAFTAWRQGRSMDVPEYCEWVRYWSKHPGYDWHLIPDVIDGNESDNRELVQGWTFSREHSVPVWHMHESLDYLAWLAERFPRVAIGSSGEYATIGTGEWWPRISEAMAIVCDGDGHPRVKLHGLRQMDATVFSHVPYASVDSTAVARNIGIDSKWDAMAYTRDTSRSARAVLMADRLERHASASRWEKAVDRRSEMLFG